jgi:ubiquitin carboxyl-terminal hydrolase L5
LSNCEPIREAHNSFARPEPFVFTNEKPAKKVKLFVEREREKIDDATPLKLTAMQGDDVFHFVGFLPVAGRLYELDGLTGGPIDHGACSNDNWLSLVVPLIQRRIAQYSSKEIKFNLLAMVNNHWLLDFNSFSFTNHARSRVDWQF